MLGRCIPIGHPHRASPLLVEDFSRKWKYQSFPTAFFLFQKVCTHLHNWSGLFFSSPFRNCFELRMCCLDHNSYKVRELKNFAVGTWKSQGVFPYIAAEAFVAHSGLKGYYSKFIPEFFFFFPCKKWLQWALKFCAGRTKACYVPCVRGTFWVSSTTPLIALTRPSVGGSYSFLPAHFLLMALGSPLAASAEMNQDSA